MSRANSDGCVFDGLLVDDLAKNVVSLGSSATMPLVLHAARFLCVLRSLTVAARELEIEVLSSPFSRRVADGN